MILDSFTEWLLLTQNMLSFSTLPYDMCEFRHLDFADSKTA